MRACSDGYISSLAFGSLLSQRLSSLGARISLGVTAFLLCRALEAITVCIGIVSLVGEQDFRRARSGKIDQREAPFPPARGDLRVKRGAIDVVISTLCHRLDESDGYALPEPWAPTKAAIGPTPQNPLFNAF
jgi:hypothetical protein